MNKLLIATCNKGKLVEIEKLLSESGINVEVLSLDDYPDMPETIEDGVTFEQNAVKKAVEASKYTGLLTLADDSGLEVDYLDGKPGVYSARFAGDDKSDDANNKKLLEMMKDVKWEDRTARFKCVIAICTPNQKIHIAEGTCEGYILDKPRGEKGFGYDPLFYSPEFKKTFAELDMHEKNRVSHRSMAIKKAIEILKEILR
ncbi:XTP/dITP diphosphatase [Peptococcaceae bacterium]|nr:XTP/dITP diphosphatase [Peptococcaceae bacterium]